MGIPKFYRWLSERYPLTSQPLGTIPPPEMDNLYLDMNGIIHNCTHGNDPGTVLTEEEMIMKVFKYIDKLIQVVKPQKLIYMAIDGVAPRAKMNQQRARRFKAAREREELEAAALAKGEPLPGGGFDSNCITPGTPFMMRLAAHLRFMCRQKIAEDPLWQQPNVIFSGHDVPGEGEHKIMEYIRDQKRQPGWQPNRRHCLYGLDADLIMLALVTHEPHFCLLREIVHYNNESKGGPAREALENPCENHFMLLHIGMLRDYFDLEFRAESLPFAYDLERVVDDFVLFCMLVGNDFLPHLPTLDIGEGALQKMFGVYKELLPQMGGYLTNAGLLHQHRLGTFMTKLAETELEVLEQRAEDAEWFDRKRGRSNGGTGAVLSDAPPAAAAAEWSSGGRGTGARGRQTDRTQAFAGTPLEELFRNGAEDAECIAAALKDLAPGAGTVSGAEAVAMLGGELEPEPEPEAKPCAGPTMMSVEARRLFKNGNGTEALVAWRERYYREKLGILEERDRRVVAATYVHGLQWVLQYYYRGVASWQWFYPYHYAPLARDLTNLPPVTEAFEQGKPFQPFQQLLSVLPAASCQLLPEPYRWLMTDPASPIIDYYPRKFEVDQEGVKSDWQGVVLVKFIDEARLLQAYNSVPESSLRQEERDHNRLGRVLLFKYSLGSTERDFCSSTLPGRMPDVGTCNSTCEALVPLQPLPVGVPGFQPHVVPGTKTGRGAPRGFPSLRTLDVKSEVKAIGCTLHGRASQSPSCVVSVANAPVLQLSTAAIAQQLVGQRCWVRWPYLTEAKVEAISDDSHKYSAPSAAGGGANGSRKGGQGNGSSGEPQATAHGEEHQLAVGSMRREMLSKQAIEVGEQALILHVQLLEGLVRCINGTLQKRFAKQETLYPFHLTLRKHPSPGADESSSRIKAQDALHSRLVVGSRALFLGSAYYGCVATILPAAAGQGLSRNGAPRAAAADRFRVRVQLPPASDGTARRFGKAILLNAGQATYLSSFEAAKQLGISTRALGRVAGACYIVLPDGEKLDVGLTTKSNKDDMCVPDYTRPAPNSNGWQYSQAMVGLLRRYKAENAWVWRLLQLDGEGALDAAAAFPEGTPVEAIRSATIRVREWVRKLPIAKRPLVPGTAQVATETAVRNLAMAVGGGGAEQRAQPVELENVAVGLLLPQWKQGDPHIAGGELRIADRVVCISQVSPPGVPFGARGTVVGVHGSACEVLFDQEFEEGTDLHGRCNSKRGQIVPNYMLLSLSLTHALRPANSNMWRKVSVPQPARPALPSAAASTSAALAAMLPGLRFKAAWGDSQAPTPVPPSVEAARDFRRLAEAQRASNPQLHPPPPPAPQLLQRSPPRLPQPNAGQLLLESLRSGGKASSRTPAQPAAPPPPPTAPPSLQPASNPAETTAAPQPAGTGERERASRKPARSPFGHHCEAPRDTLGASDAPPPTPPEDLRRLAQAKVASEVEATATLSGAEASTQETDFWKSLLNGQQKASRSGQKGVRQMVVQNA